MVCKNCHTSIYKSSNSFWLHNNKNGATSVQFCMNVREVYESSGETEWYKNLARNASIAEPSKENNVIDILREVDKLGR